MLLSYVGCVHSSQGFSVFNLQEVIELQQQLQSCKRGKEIFRQQLMKWKEAELTRAEETIRREQQQVIIYTMVCL